MAKQIIKHLPLNRVEGDLEIKVEVNDGVVTDAWSSGTMFRGFERILVGRGALDGLVITPRICGLCNTCHLNAAARALDMIADVKIPDNAVRLRNVTLMTEHIMSDMRHGFLMFLVDFANPHYRDHSLYEEAVKRYEPYRGSAVLGAVAATKQVLEIIAIIGGQWPHTSFMVPGGIASIPDKHDLLMCEQILRQYRRWYETNVLGCGIDRVNGLKNLEDLDCWLEESEAHRNSELGFYIRFSREAGLHATGKGHGNFINYGAFTLPEQTGVKPRVGSRTLIPGGFIEQDGTLTEFDQSKIAEDVYHSWFKDQTGGLHPFQGETEPYATGDEGRKYSWCKAPRYNGKPAETGPLAEMLVSGRSLFTDMIGKHGPNVFSRELARLLRPALFIPVMETWLREVHNGEEIFYTAPGKIQTGEGYGLTHAARGALGHWVKIQNGKIQSYQIITPTTWNASPRDASEVRGPWEEALIGTPVKDAENPVEIGHVVRSYDACLVCTVHTFGKGGKTGRLVL